MEHEAQSDPAIEFPEWPEVLAGSGLPERRKESFRITIRWYLFLSTGAGEGHEADGAGVYRICGA